MCDCACEADEGEGGEEETGEVDEVVIPEPPMARPNDTIMPVADESSKPLTDETSKPLADEASKPSADEASRRSEHDRIMTYGYGYMLPPLPPASDDTQYYECTQGDDEVALPRLKGQVITRLANLPSFGSTLPSGSASTRAPSSASLAETVLETPERMESRNDVGLPSGQITPSPVSPPVVFKEVIVVVESQRRQ